MASIAVLLLAAGESTRMGELKALLQWQDKTLIEHQVTALASAGVSRTIVVLGHQSERLESLLKDRAGVYYVYNPDYRQGKTTSIKAGLRALKSPPVPPLTKGGKGKVGSTPPGGGDTCPERGPASLCQHHPPGNGATPDPPVSPITKGGLGG